MLILSCSADHEQDWQSYPVDPYSAERSDYTHILTSAGTFNIPTSYQQGVWEREAHINGSMMTCHGSTRSELS